MTLRGRHDGALPVHWRGEGGTDDPRAPLVLALHGMGMDEDFLAGLLEDLFRLPARFLIPRAFHPVVTGTPPRPGASWYHYDGDQENFRRELERMESVLLDFLPAVEAAQGWEPRARILFGFSQGGYGGAYFALRHPDLFAGMMISGARVKWEFLQREIQEAGRRGMKVLLMHGSRDRSVSPQAATGSRDALAAGGVEVTLRTFDTDHIIGRSQVAVMAEWLAANFAVTPPSTPRGR